MRIFFAINIILIPILGTHVFYQINTKYFSSNFSSMFQAHFDTFESDFTSEFGKTKCQA